MTAAEFCACLAAIGLTPHFAGPLIGRSRRQAFRYASGQTPIPDLVAWKVRWECDNTSVVKIGDKWRATRDGRLKGYYDTEWSARAASLDLPR